MAKITLTIQLQDDAGVPILTGNQTKNAFVGSDFDLVRGFLIGSPVQNLLRLMGWIADGRVTYTAAQTLTISQL
jgi:hypothetical protein